MMMMMTKMAKMAVMMMSDGSGGGATGGALWGELGVSAGRVSCQPVPVHPSSGTSGTDAAPAPPGVMHLHQHLVRWDRCETGGVACRPGLTQQGWRWAQHQSYFQISQCVMIIKNMFVNFMAQLDAKLPEQPFYIWCRNRTSWDISLNLCFDTYTI